jgi:hypothetical protein
MHRIDTANVATVLPAAKPVGSMVGYFQNADPLNDIDPTKLDADWFNSIQESLVALLTSVGISPVKGTHTQVRDAILAMISANTGSQPGIHVLNNVAPVWTSADMVTIKSGFKCVSDDGITSISFTSDEAVNLAGTPGNVNSLAGGQVRGSSKKYVLYAITDSNGVNPPKGLWSEQGVIPTLPTGYNKKQKICPWVNNASNQLMRGNVHLMAELFIYTDMHFSGCVSFVAGETNILAGVTNSATWTDADLKPYVPAGCIAALLDLVAVRTADSTVRLRTKGDTGSGLEIYTDVDGNFMRTFDREWRLEPSGSNQGLVQYWCDLSSTSIYLNVAGYHWKHSLI